MRSVRLLVIGSLLLSALYAPVLSEQAGIPAVSRVSAGTYCADGTYSSSTGPGTCSWHGGIAGGRSDTFRTPRQGRFGQPPTNNSWNSNPWGNSWSLTPLSTPRPFTLTPIPTIRPLRTLSPILLTPLNPIPTIRPLPTLSPIRLTPLNPIPTFNAGRQRWMMCRNGLSSKMFFASQCPEGWN
jgi:hypothetical protein